MSNKHEEKGISDIIAWTLANKGGGGDTGEYATKKDLQLVEENKADRSIYLLDNSVVTQADARDILAYADQYTGIIEFISTSESKVSAIGYIISNSDGTCLVTITNDGTSTQWSKDGFSKYNVEARNLINEPIVDTDNLTVDVVGNPPVLYMLRNAMNKPEGSGADGSMMVIPHSISKQIFVYTDMDTAKMWTKVVTGTDGQHSFGTWNALGGSTSGGGVGQKGTGEHAESFNGSGPLNASGSYAHAEGEGYAKMYPGVHVSNLRIEEKRFDIDADIPNEKLPYMLYFLKDGTIGAKVFVKEVKVKDAVTSIVCYERPSDILAGMYDMYVVKGVASKDGSHAEGTKGIANAKHSHVEGDKCIVTGAVQKDGTLIGKGIAGHAEGTETIVMGEHGHSEGFRTQAIGQSSHAEGDSTTASGDSSHAEGVSTKASGPSSHAEGNYTTASGYCSHAEGNHTTASGDSSHAEGVSTTSSGDYGSHAEGIDTTASGNGSHAEGVSATASGYGSHAEGESTIASGKYGSHAEGQATTASSNYQHVQGQYNIDDPTGKYAHIVGNGTGNSFRSNAHTIDWKGNSWYQGAILVGGTNMDTPMGVLAPDHIIIKASDSEDRFKITVDKTGAIKAEKVI